MTTTILFFDTETNGLPTKRNAFPDEVDVWPRMQQLAWAVGDAASVTKSASYIIKPEGWTVDNESPATKVHGITRERAMAEGVPIEDVLEAFRADVGLNEVEKVVAHNVDFDYGVAGAEFIRAGFFNHLDDKPRCCTMKCSTGLCKIPQKNGRGYKWPKLMELHQFLFGRGFEKAHDAAADVVAGIRCYWELKKRGVLL
jgi:DNA polymerase III epsilon subunit-like protein